MIGVRTVAALFVQRGGAYWNLPGVDPWDEERDARLYDGPHPVVAHPPCARWSRFAGFVESVYGHKRGDDAGCFEAALRAVRTFGGVLEHPAHSAAWDAFDLPKPIAREGWTLALDGGASCYVEQGRYGLPAKKATWLFAYGVELADLRWGYTPDGRGTLATNQDPTRGGMHAWRDLWKAGWSLRPGQRRPDDLWRGTARASSTPPEFRDALIAMARSVQKSCLAPSVYRKETA